MALEALSSTQLLNFIMYDSTLSSPITPFPNDSPAPHPPPPPPTQTTAPAPAPSQGRKKRRRKPAACKNKKEAETQRMTHIAVERNRRKQMNEHLAVIRSLMPESYVQRGDQASIVGGAIEFVKELEHILQSLEAKKYALLVQGNGQDQDNKGYNFVHCLGNSPPQNTDDIIDSKPILGTSTTTTTTTTTPFSQFFSYPQFSCSHNQLGNKYSSQSMAAIADIEVTLIETHANIRILSQRRVQQLSKIVAFFHSVLLSILHLNVTTLDSFVLYSISAKVEEGCQLNSADDIAGAVHRMLRIIEEESILVCET